MGLGKTLSMLSLVVGTRSGRPRLQDAPPIKEGSCCVVAVAVSVVAVSVVVSRPTTHLVIPPHTLTHTLRVDQVSRHSCGVPRLSYDAMGE